MAFGTGSVKAVGFFGSVYTSHVRGGRGVQAPGDNGGPSGGRAGVHDSSRSPQQQQHHGPRGGDEKRQQTGGAAVQQVNCQAE